MKPADTDAPTIMEAADGQVLTLVAKGGRLAGKRFSGFGKSLTLGRSKESSLAIPLPRLSRQQAQIQLEGGRFWISDLSPRNPTKLNETILQGSAPLSDGDVLRVGDQDFVVKVGIEHATIEDPNRPAAPARPQRWPWIAAGAVTLLSLAFFISRPSTKVTAPHVTPLTGVKSESVPPTLELAEVVAERAPFSGELRRLARPGSRVASGELLFELLRTTPALRKARDRVEALKKHAGDAEYADFVHAARTSLQQEESRGRTLIRASAEGIVILGAVQVGQTVEVGDEVLRVAGRARLSVGSEPISGTGATCRVTPLGSPERVALTGRWQPGRRVLELETRPTTAWAPEPGKVRIQCD